MKALLSMDPAAFPLVFGPAERARLLELLDIDLAAPDRRIEQLNRDVRQEVELLITGWGAQQIGQVELDMLPSLRAVIHWGGGVGFIDPVASLRGIAVASARAENAIPVAEFTVAMITLAAKDAFWVSREYTQRKSPIHREMELTHTGLYRRGIGIVGASTIGTRVMATLIGNDVDVFLYDPHASSGTAARYGAELVPDLQEMARRCTILSIHAPEIPETRQMISAEVLAALPDLATVINTARGSLIDQAALVDELRTGRLRAILDVTEPEVLPADHPLYSLPNVFLTPHLAGSTGSELRRLGHAAVAEVERFVRGQPFQHPMSI